MESETACETKTYLKVLQARAESLLALIKSLETYEKEFKEGRRSTTKLKEIRRTAEDLKNSNDVFSEIIWTYNEGALKTPAQLAQEQEVKRKEEEIKSAIAQAIKGEEEDDEMTTID